MKINQGNPVNFSPTSTQKKTSKNTNKDNNNNIKNGSINNRIISAMNRPRSAPPRINGSNNTTGHRNAIAGESANNVRNFAAKQISESTKLHFVAMTIVEIAKELIPLPEILGDTQAALETAKDVLEGAKHKHKMTLEELIQHDDHETINGELQQMLDQEIKDEHKSQVHKILKIIEGDPTSSTRKLGSKAIKILLSAMTGGGAGTAISIVSGVEKSISDSHKETFKKHLTQTIKVALSDNQNEDVGINMARNVIKSLNNNSLNTQEAEEKAKRIGKKLHGDPNICLDESEKDIANKILFTLNKEGAMEKDYIAYLHKRVNEAPPQSLTKT